MAFTNSKLATYISISPNKTTNRNQSITKITVHHMAGVCTLEQFNSIVKNPARQMSSNYAIDKDGRIGLFCEEKDRSWCSSSPWNDHRAITIEVSNSAVGDASGWPISEKVFNKLVDLCVDICQRNGIKKLEYTGNTNGSLTYHYMFASTACLPVDRTELLTPSGWKLLKDVNIGDTVATVHIDNLGIKFDTVENMVPLKTQDTYTTRDFEATSDHRIMYCNQLGRIYTGQYKDIYDSLGQLYFVNAGYLENPQGFANLCSSEIEFLVAVQADGHYMKDGNCLYGIEFHLKKPRKIKRLKKLFKVLRFDYKECHQSDGTTKLRIYGKKYVEMCEQFLDNKCFTWDWLNMNHIQFDHFMDAILQYDGCEANMSYSSAIRQNVDIVQAIAALNGVGSKITKEHDRVYFKKIKRSLGENKRKRHTQQKVSCVTVRSGFILIRQHGRTTITGNCPGPWMKAHTQELCDKVNARLNNVPTPNPVPSKPVTNNNKSFKKGDLISINNGSKWYTGSSIPDWVSDENWYISSISGDRAVLGLNESKNRNIQSPINTKDISLVSTGNVVKQYTVTLKSSDKIYDQNGNPKKTIGSNGIFTIVEEKIINGTTYGKLKSGAGWVITKQPNVDTEIRKGDKVAVINAVQYGTNKSFKTYVSTYYVLEVNGNRIVISSDGKNVTAAVDKKNLKKI